ncbi:NAD(P)-binding protein [Trematosphaeria pertusa]|uniref:NAD(P)-binding protein n=1 Tax=Trematosphaeria pertusa TaxID=390896 RepID=A0A6A6IAH0_9PLEO|nr:NAD(P)-binding protein [Trematosphaeria pertusa]KAF2247565.1 NAD(P)-binding protein [Trematosphaeria pertusa]
MSGGKHLLVVFGATGNQGGSVAHAVLSSPDLSQRYSVRAITRNPNTPAAQALASAGAEVVRADMDDPSTLPGALKNASFIFAVTNTHYGRDTKAIETAQAQALCSEALRQGAQYIIWSSMSHPVEISGGKLKRVEHFDVKAEIETYIRGLPVKSAFFAPAGFFQNYYTSQKPRPSTANDGTYVLASLCRGDTVLPQLDITDTGAWVSAILAEPEKYEGKFFAAAEGLYTMDEVAATMSKVSGKTVKFQHVPDEVFKGFLPEGYREQLFEMYLLFRDYGYYGENMKEQVEWAKAQARGKLTNLEEFLRKTEFKLE